MPPDSLPAAADPEARQGQCNEARAAHRLQAGAGILLHPSRFEPCGLAPMDAMRYGTLPLVRRTGGLTDLVIGADSATAVLGQRPAFRLPMRAARICASR